MKTEGGEKRKFESSSRDLDGHRASGSSSSRDDDSLSCLSLSDIGKTLWRKRRGKMSIERLKDASPATSSEGRRERSAATHPVGSLTGDSETTKEVNWLDSGVGPSISRMKATSARRKEKRRRRGRCRTNLILIAPVSGRTRYSAQPEKTRSSVRCYRVFLSGNQREETNQRGQ